jgi:hypothetical protein
MLSLDPRPKQRRMKTTEQILSSRTSMLPKFVKTRFQAPKWLRNQIWDIIGLQTRAGWNIHLRTYRLMNWRVLDIISSMLRGEIDYFAERFADGRFSPYDRDTYGRTLLHMAALVQNTSVIKFFIDQGADVGALNDSGQYVEIQNMLEFIKILIITGRHCWSSLIPACTENRPPPKKAFGC